MARDLKIAELERERDEFRLAATALAELVQAEYPDCYSLHQIAEVWGEKQSAAVLAALRRAEPRLGLRD